MNVLQEDRLPEILLVLSLVADLLDQFLGTISKQVPKFLPSFKIDGTSLRQKSHQL
jgi:hypothetical protein